MIVPAPPPAATCLLPGPWHDSQPAFLALSPGALSRACVAVRKLRVIFSWQVSHASDPTKVAPGILGGASKVRFEVREVQESKITVSATPLPAAQQSFSRVPLSHRVSLECSTIGAVLRIIVRDDYAFLRKKRPVFCPNHRFE
jgi:hypothetical protein